MLCMKETGHPSAVVAPFLPPDADEREAAGGAVGDSHRAGYGRLAAGGGRRGALPVAARGILRYPHPALKSVCAPVGRLDAAARALAADLVAALEASPGVG